MKMIENKRFLSFILRGPFFVISEAETYSSVVITELYFYDLFRFQCLSFCLNCVWQTHLPE
jgi:hypothetical protein